MPTRGSKLNKDDAQTVVPTYKQHAVWHGDSVRIHFQGRFHLVLCSPPFFHPSQTSPVHGATPRLRDLDLFADWTAQILVRAAKTLKAGQPLCFVKTDVKYKSTLLPIGFRIAERCEKLGLPIQAHWIWQRLIHFSPYSPSLANIFVLGNANPELLRGPAVLRTSDCSSRKLPTSFTPELFQQLIQQLTPLNGRVLDPFVGIGSTILAASRCRRWAVGVEVSRDQFLKAKQILRSVSAIHFHWLREDRGRY
jgi:DNA modification methylase